MDQLTEWAHLLLMWVGFGTIVGLIAKAIMPGRDPGGAFATVFIGIFGSIFGAGTFFFFSGIKVSPISLPGFLTALVATLVILGSYRLMSGRFAGQGPYFWRWRRTRRRVSVFEE